ncbi:MAG: hypothetical protein WD771_10525 [Gemmatimonadaceae bacterium]
MSRDQVILSWSGGKDRSLALPALRAAPDVGETCDSCGDDRLVWRNCKQICENCRQINKSCADL